MSNTLTYFCKYLLAIYLIGISFAKAQEVVSLKKNTGNGASKIEQNSDKKKEYSLEHLLEQLEQKYDVYLNCELNLIEGKKIKYNPNKKGQALVEELNNVLKPFDLSFMKVDSNYYIIYDEKNEEIKSVIPVKKPGKNGPKARDGSKQLVNRVESMKAGIRNYLETRTVTGTVIDGKSEEELPGVNVIVPGTNRGTVTNADGKFTLNVPDSVSHLLFSFVGYADEKVNITNRNNIKVQLIPDVESLEEVVVIGYGETSPEDATGSVQAIGKEDFNKGNISSPEELFQGKAAGVNITASGGAPGASQQIRIRGGASLSASNDPLFVVDGVPLSTSGVNGMRNPLNTINPNDIEKINILKGASATAIYGSRGANGVIIINTKSGKAGQDLQINYNGQVSSQRLTQRVNVLSTEDFRETVNNQVPQGVELLGDNNTDWQDRILQNAMQHTHNLSFTGSAGNMPYRASVSYSDREGVVQTSNFERTTANVNLSPSFFDDQLRFQFNIKGVNIKNRFADNAALGNAINYDPTQPVKNNAMGGFNGGYHYWPGSNGVPNQIAPVNPVALLQMKEDISTVNRSIGNMKMDYDLPFAENFTATVNAGYDYSWSDGNTNVPNTASWQYKPALAYDSAERVARGFGQNEVLPAGGQVKTYSQKKENETLDLYLNYKKEFEGINSKIDVTGGYSWEHRYEKAGEFIHNDTSGVRAKDTIQVTADFTNERENYLVSFFSRLKYTFNEKYLLTATLRQDGTSRFSQSERWGLFPSVALGWKAHEESFLDAAEGITRLKFRASYGVTGQQNILDNWYPYMATYTQSDEQAKYQLGDTFYNTYRADGYSESLKWEETKSYNVGLDFGFWNNRLVGTIDAYHNNTTDLINMVAIPRGANLTDRLLSNIGNITNRGLEVSLTGRLITNDKFFWEVSANGSRVINEITKLTNQDNENFQGVETGGIAGGVGNNIQIHSVGQPRSSFFVFEQVYDENGDPVEGMYVDQNDDGQINTEDKVHYKNPDPDVFIGLSSKFEYQNWSFSFTSRANIGNYVYNNVNSSKAFYEAMYDQSGFLNNAPEAIRETNFQSDNYFSDHYVQDASFIRMDNMSLNYSFPEIFNESISLSLSATVQNAFVITPFSGIDPEIQNGINNEVYPRPRTFILGVNLGF